MDNGDTNSDENGTFRERDAVIKTMQSYIDGVRLGSSTVMRSGLDEAATIFGYYPGAVMTHPIQALFDWIDKNGPSPELNGIRRHRCTGQHCERSLGGARLLGRSRGNRRTHVGHLSSLHVFSFTGGCPRDKLNLLSDGIVQSKGMLHAVIYAAGRIF
jgi:putative lumazine-binding protein